MDDQNRCSTLPDEILLAIFSFLPIQDRVSAGFVCVQWYTLVGAPNTDTTFPTGTVSVLTLSCGEVSSRL